jgi:hypothetical protein
MLPKRYQNTTEFRGFTSWSGCAVLWILKGYKTRVKQGLNERKNCKTSGKNIANQLSHYSRSTEDYPRESGMGLLFY